MRQIRPSVSKADFVIFRLRSAHAPACMIPAYVVIQMYLQKDIQMLDLKWELDLDDGNRVKLCKHGLTLAMIKTFFAGNPVYIEDPGHSLEEDRYIAFGVVDRRFVFVAFTLRINSQKIKIRPISARFARAGEMRKLYEKKYKEK